MRRTLFILATLVALAGCLPAAAQQPKGVANYASGPRFKALVYYSMDVEEAHQQFALQSIDFLHKLTYGEGWVMDVTQSLRDYPYERLAEYNTLIMLNTMPHQAEERQAFERYMESGGGWVGFHAAAYNDRNTRWPWLLKFLGSGIFLCNNWPPQPALLTCDERDHPVTRNLPPEFVSAPSEWYMWDPSPRDNPDVTVLLSLSPKNYPFGLKDIVSGGDFPVVWSNTKYRMIYLNFGHGDEGYTSPTQNLLVIGALRWIVSRDPKGDPFR